MILFHLRWMPLFTRSRVSAMKACCIAPAATLPLGAERRHLGRVFCGLMCPLRYAPSESAAAGITQCLDGRPSKINDQSAPIPARRIRIANHPLRFQTHFKGKCYCAKQPAFILHPPALSGSSCLFSSLHFPDRFLRRYRSLFLWQYQDFLP